MHKAIVHIGTEKTGSTAIQNFLYKNESVLAKHGVFFPFRTCGLISNFRLAIYCLEEVDPNLVGMDKQSSKSPDRTIFSDDPDQWRREFSNDHLAQINSIHRAHKASTVVYSSEHFHSRIVKPAEIERLYDFLNPMYDSVQIIAYCRRQDRLAVSSHNTSIQGGAVNDFDFTQIQNKPSYFDYLSMMDRWASVFGKTNVSARVYERNRLVGKDIGHDFKTNILTPKILKKLERSTLQYETSNPRLSFTALKALQAFNRMDTTDAMLRGAEKASIRQALIRSLHDVNDEFGEMLPPRDTAENFYSRFRDDNARMFTHYGDGHSFNEDFSKFPESKLQMPEVDALSVLSKRLELIL